MGFDQDRFCSTPKLPLFSYSRNRAYETPGLATPPVNIAGSVPFLWEEAPGRPRKTCSSRKPPRSNPSVRGLEPPPRLDAPTTVFAAPYDLRRRSLSLSRFAKCKEALETTFDATKFKLHHHVHRKRSLFNPNSDFWARVYQGFKQVIPWRRKQENPKSTDVFFH